MRLENWFISNPDSSQQEVLKVPINENLVVKGAAGSGKTNMAIYRANQAGSDSFVIVVYTIALAKMIRFGLSELGLDKDRVVHEWSWVSRGINVSGDLFCLSGPDNTLNRDLLILKTDDATRCFVTKDKYDAIVTERKFLNFNVEKIVNPLEVSIDFDDWVDDSFYRTFYRRKRWFKQVNFVNFNPDLNNDSKFTFIPAGYIFKDKGDVNYVIVDEGQDFSLSSYSQHFISQAKKSLTVFGDTNQRIYKDRFCDIEDVSKSFKYPLLNLDYNYRVPKTIAKIAQKIPQPNIDLLSNNKKSNGDSDYPSFPKPIIKKCDEEEDELKFILNRIQTEAMDDVAILLPTEEHVKKVHKFFSEMNIGTQVRIAVDIGVTSLGNRKFKRVDTLDFTNHDLPAILTYHSGKGTEFDNVFIPFAEQDMNLDRNPFYVAVTRASSMVFITYTRYLTRLLSNIDPHDVIHQ